MIWSSILGSPMATDYKKWTHIFSSYGQQKYIYQSKVLAGVVQPAWGPMMSYEPHGTNWFFRQSVVRYESYRQILEQNWLTAYYSLPSLLLIEIGPSSKNKTTELESKRHLFFRYWFHVVRSFQPFLEQLRRKRRSWRNSNRERFFGGFYVVGHRLPIYLARRYLSVGWRHFMPAISQLPYIYFTLYCDLDLSAKFINPTLFEQTNEITMSL